MSTTANAREVLYEQRFADGFVSSETAYVVFFVPEGFVDVTLSLDCNIHVGAIALWKPNMPEYPGEARYAGACDGLAPRELVVGLAGPGYYYGSASFTGVNGAVLRVTGEPGA